MTTPPTPPVPVILMPENITLAKRDGNAAVFGVWPSGYVRQITACEYARWGFPAIHYTISADPSSDAEFNQLAAYDRALRA